MNKILVFLNQYESNNLEHTLNLIFMHLGFIAKPYEYIKKRINDTQKIKNIQKIDALLFSITKYMMKQSYTVEAKDKNLLKDKPFSVLEYLECLAQTQKDTEVEKYIQAAINAFYTIPSVHSMSSLRN